MRGAGVSRPGSSGAYPDLIPLCFLLAARAWRKSYKLRNSVSELPYQLLALDLDGTLVTDDLIITQPVKAAIARAGQQGVIVTLSTGRMFQSALQFARELDLAVPLICYQGAMVRHSLTGETIYHQPVPLEVAQHFIAKTMEQRLHVNSYVDDRLYVAEMNEAARYYADLARVEANIVGDLLAFTDRPDRAPTKLVVVTEEDRTLAVVQEYQAAFGAGLYVTRSHARFAEAVNPQCNKGTALAALAKSLDIPREKVLAIGDNLNDLPMLKWAGLGIAVGNAGPIVQQSAHHVTQGRFAEGVIEAINEFVLV